MVVVDMAEDRQIVGVVLLAILALIGIILFAGVAGPIGSAGVGTVDERMDTPTDGDSVSFDVGLSADEIDVLASREHAIAIDGDGYLAADIDDEWTDGDWTVLLAPQLADSANENAAYAVFSSADESVVIQYENGEWLAYAENDFGENATVSVPADTDSFDPVVVSYDATANDLSIEVDGHSDTATPDFAEEDRMLAADWRGNLDEIRVVNATVTTADTDSYLGDPVAPLPDSEGEHTARLMFNEGEGDSVELFYASGTAELVGATWTDGVAAPEMVEGTDYAVGENEVTILDGYLDGAPVAFIVGEGTLGGPFDAVVSGFGDAMNLIPIVLIATVAGIVLLVIGRVRGESP